MVPAVLALAGVALVWAQRPSAEDVALSAMRDEVARSKAMSLPNLDPPYFVQYLVDESSNFTVSASLGGVLSQRTQRVRAPEVRVRVGNYKFDNSNYTGSSFNFGARYDLGAFPLEDRYDLLRRHLWLQTDSAYKSAVEALSRKRAAVRNLNQTEQLADFAKAAPLKQLHPLSKLTIDANLWTGRVREISSMFARYP